MHDLKLDLSIPQKEIRTDIRKLVASYFEINKVLPPVSYEEVSLIASKILHENTIDKKHQAFAMVCCGNAIWRKVVETIPYNRRILLLPECLKDSFKCQAEQDDLGLLCSDCGACSISDTLGDAENLGYVALVTEGTTVTTRLIESGKVDAVIGVGCMEVLQKMFASVSKFAIPSIGVPLLTCGCKDTTVDEAWLKEEINHYKANEEIRLINLNHLQSRIKAVFGDEQLNRLAGKTKSKTEALAREYLLADGQRIRPFLTALAYESFSKNADLQTSNRLAVSVECFHKASLVHDDIEDKDEFRNGKETLHKKYGVPIALNIGDLLIGEGYRLISDSKLNSELKEACTRIASEGHVALSVGQGTELMANFENTILSVEQMLEVFENKTAAAFRVSLLMGASVGGADELSLQEISNFSSYIGIAYQIKDDLNDYTGDDGDVQSRGFSILLSLLHDKLSEEEKNKVPELMETNPNALNDLFIAHNIQEETEVLLNNYLDKAKKSIEQFENIGFKLALHEILGKIFKDYL